MFFRVNFPIHKERTLELCVLFKTIIYFYSNRNYNKEFDIFIFVNVKIKIIIL